MSQDVQSLSKVSIKPVYNVAQGTNLEFLPFDLGLASSTMTLSTAVITTPTKTLDTITAEQVTSGFPALVQKQDTVGFYNQGDDTQFERILFIKSNFAYEVTQCFLQFAMGMVLTAWTSNEASFDSIDVEVRVYDGTQTTSYITIAKKTFTTGFANQVGTDAGDIYIVQMQFSGEHVKSNDTIGIYIKTNVTQVATNTYRVGLLPLFPFTITDYTKPFYQSGLASHTMPSFDAAQQAFKNMKPNYPLDIFGAGATI